MTREEAIKAWRGLRGNRTEAHLRERLPQHIVDRIMDEDAEDVIEGLSALGVLILDQPTP